MKEGEGRASGLSLELGYGLVVSFVKGRLTAFFEETFSLKP